jgi:hypothetical protein
MILVSRKICRRRRWCDQGNDKMIRRRGSLYLSVPSGLERLRFFDPD